MDLKHATAIAEFIKEELLPYCDRIEIAGSIRRLKIEVKDIEIVVVPKFRSVNNLFGEPTAQFSTLDEYLSNLEWGRIKDGHKYKQFILPQGIKLDLFIVTPPAHWGVIFTLRTGPDNFSKWCVTQRSKGGCLPSDCEVEGGAVIRNDQVVAMPEEIDFLNLLGLGWIEPKDRVPNWNRRHWMIERTSKTPSP